MTMKGDKTILPHDIIIDILKRLPVKSLIRFQCVCKLWKNLIKTPSFITTQLHHSSHKNPLLVLNAMNITHIFPPLYLLDCNMQIIEVQKRPLIDSLSFVWIVGSCNGLLCVRLDYDNGRSLSLLLWNPAIREVRQVPITINEYLSFCSLGFGFSSVINDYKIVKICYPKFYDENGHQVYVKKICVNQVTVYSLSTGLWKEVEFGVIQNVRDIDDAIVANETLFSLGLGNDDDHLVVVSFNMATEVFALIPIPLSASNFHDNRLTVCNNKLALLHLHYVTENFETSFIHLWAMEEDISASRKSWSWTKKYCIGPNSIKLYPKCIWRNEIVCDFTKRESESENEVKYNKTFLSLFNLTTNELKEFPNIEYPYHYCGIKIYTESLVSVCNTHVE